MEPITALTRVAAMRRAMAIPDDEDIERAWRRWTGLDLEARNVREALRGEESNGSELDRCPSLHRGGDSIAQDAGCGEGDTVHGTSATGAAAGFRWN